MHLNDWTVTVKRTDGTESAPGMFRSGRPELIAWAKTRSADEGVSLVVLLSDNEREQLCYSQGEMVAYNYLVDVRGQSTHRHQRETAA